MIALHPSVLVRTGLALAAIFSPAVAATAATHVAEAGDYHVVARTDSPRPGFIRLNIEAQRVAGGTPASDVQLHAFFLDADGLIMGEAPLARTHADGLTLTAHQPALRVPEGATTLAVLAEPGTTRAIAAGPKAAPATALIPLD